METLYGRHSGELFTLAKNLPDRVAKGLMLKYGCVLDEGRVGRGYELAVDDPVAKLLSRYFSVSMSRRKMDHSPSELEGEIDHLSRDASIEYLLMPERIKKLEGQATALSGQVEELQSDVHQLVQVLKEALAPKENRVPPLKDANSKFSSKHPNVLVLDVDRWTIGLEDVQRALYGDNKDGLF